MAEVVRTKRTVVQATLKDSTNSAVGSAVIVPVYDAFNPYSTDIETQPMNRARNTLDPEQFWVGIAVSRLQGNFYVYGTGAADVAYGGMDVDTLAEALALAPPWARTFLPAAGFTPSITTPTMDEEVYLCYNPVSDTFYQLDFLAYLNSYKHIGTKSRGNLVFSGEASNPVQVAFDYMGQYTKGVWEANIDDSGSDPGLPPRLCGADSFRMRAQGKGTMFLPKLKSFSLDLGRAPEQRRHANIDGCLEEITFKAEAAPRLQIVVEVENMTSVINGTGFTTVADFIESCRQGQKYAVELNIGAWASNAQGGRWQFRNYHDSTTEAPATAGDGSEIEAATDFRAQMTRAPQYVDVANERCLDMEFQLGGDADNFLQIIGM